jgi:chloramphenicol O-acetyltransferase type B
MPMNQRLEETARRALGAMRGRSRPVQHAEMPGMIRTREVYPQYEIGRATYGVPKLAGGAMAAGLQIGAFCSIGPDVTILLGGEHRSDWVTTFPFTRFWPAASGIPDAPHPKGDVVIGNDVWIGRSATIMSGVQVGDGAIVGACSLVTKDVEPYAIVGGNPARLIKMRFDADTVERLCAIRWWDWQDARIEEYLPLLLNDRVEDFLAAAESDARG